MQGCVAVLNLEMLSKYKVDRIYDSGIVIVHAKSIVTLA